MSTESDRLLWDGSFLGTFGINSIESERKIFKTIKIAVIRTSHFKTECVIRRAKDHVLVCILDELKNCFGLEKMGTHHIQLGSKFYVLIQYNPSIFPLRNTFSPDSFFEAEMRKYVAYRILLQIPNTTNRSFLVKKEGDIYHPISFIEKDTYPDRGCPQPSGLFLLKWFGTREISEEIRSLFPKKVWEDWSEFLLGFRGVLLEKIHNINPDYVGLASFIIGRMNAFVD